MKLVSFLKNANQSRLGLLVNGMVYDVNQIDNQQPDNMLDLLKKEEKGMADLRVLQEKINTGSYQEMGVAFNEVCLLAPIPNPTSCRDGYAFRQHVASARRNRGVPMIPEFDQYPIMYFTNHNAVQGPGDVRCMPDHFDKLDFELEVAAIIGKKGRNIKASDADKYIAGYTIMNDMSARTLQMEEMLLNLGPAKGKDFSTVIGPYMITPDELEDFKISAKENHIGNNYNLAMKCLVNGIEVSSGNVGDMDWTFAEIIERCAYGVDIFPGDVIGSGTVGTGCFLELNGTGLLNDKNFMPQWLEANDIVEMEITGLGKLINKIVAEPSDFSILKLKKPTL
ncbi:MAG: fumarylacetoacetate hydrolase family protein [Bacteroidota bacterium]|nr:fumarylacetoacetate hydrolase family protein [Bacteroidota bacterium]